MKTMQLTWTRRLRRVLGDKRAAHRDTPTVRGALAPTVREEPDGTYRWALIEPGHRDPLVVGLDIAYDTYAEALEQAKAKAQRSEESYDRWLASDPGQS